MMMKAVDPSRPVVPATSNHSIYATMIVVALCLLPEVALAQATGGNPILSMINGIIAFLNNGVMRGIAIIALFAIAMLCYRGKITFEHAGYACGGIILTFGGAGLVDQFSGYVA